MRTAFHYQFSVLIAQLAEMCARAEQTPGGGAPFRRLRSKFAWLPFADGKIVESRKTAVEQRVQVDKLTSVLCNRGGGG
jgi:hypothetical protein